MEFVPLPTATNNVPFHAMPLPYVEKTDVPNPVHVMPSEECAMVFVPLPTATHRIPFHATSSPHVENMEVPTPVQLMPSEE